MTEPMDTVRDILYPDFSAKVTPIRPPAPSCPTAVQFAGPDPIDVHGDDFQAAADGDWTPDPRDIC